MRDGSDVLADQLSFRPLATRHDPVLPPLPPPSRTLAKRNTGAAPRRRGIPPHWLTLLLLLASSAVSGAAFKAVYLAFDAEGSAVDRAANEVGSVALATLEEALRVGQGLASTAAHAVVRIANRASAPSDERAPPPAGRTVAIPLMQVADVTETQAVQIPPPPPAAPPPQDDPAPPPPRPISQPAPPDAPPAPRMDPAEASRLRARGDEFLRRHDVSAARLFFVRAADGGDAASAAAVGKTFDPAFLRRIGAVGVNGDRAQAAVWYARARDLGDEEAVVLLRNLPPE
jgi:outer membrane biosynthesis protein TonB